MTAALDVEGQLTILAGDHAFRVEFRGDIVAVVLPDLRAARALRRLGSRRDRQLSLRSVQAALGRAGLELQVWAGSEQVARLAGVTRPGRLSAWLGLGPLELRPRAVLAALARRRFPPSDRKMIS